MCVCNFSVAGSCRLNKILDDWFAFVGFFLYQSKCQLFFVVVIGFLNYPFEKFMMIIMSYDKTNNYQSAFMKMAFFLCTHTQNSTPFNSIINRFLGFVFNAHI